MNQEKKRIFFGLNAISPWPDSLPKGRIIEVENRHMTFIFLGEKPLSDLLPLLRSFPKPPFRVGLAGVFHSCRPLPPRHPRVIAWETDFFDLNEALRTYRKQVLEWLGVHGLAPPKADKHFIPHVTLCRKPFCIEEWKKVFVKLPVVCDTIHLFESLGFSKYNSLWKYSLLPPIQELEHTADIAFLIRGETYPELYWNACIALCFPFPELISLCKPNPEMKDLDTIIVDLNALIAEGDKEFGSPLKAVSFHGKIREHQDLLEWEMIIDV